MTEDELAAIEQRAYGWRFGTGNSGQVRRAADDVYALLADHRRLQRAAQASQRVYEAIELDPDEPDADTVKGIPPSLFAEWVDALDALSVQPAPPQGEDTPTPGAALDSGPVR